MNNLINWQSIFPSLSRKSSNPFFSLHQEIEKAFNTLYQSSDLDNFFQKEIQNLTIRPAFDVVEDEKTYKIEMEMPGLSEEDINVSVKQGTLCIQAKKEVSKKNQEKNYTRREITYGNYESYIDLPKNIDEDKAKASFKKGMLWITFPKKEGTTEENIKKLTIEKAE